MMYMRAIEEQSGEWAINLADYLEFRRKGVEQPSRYKIKGNFKLALMVKEGTNGKKARINRRL